MTCYKPGERSRLFYSVREYTGRKDQPKGFGWRDFRDLLIRARTDRRPDRPCLGQRPLAPDQAPGTDLALDACTGWSAERR
jgi:hypothetical protein